ncbi:butyrate kinase [bacterium]|nr:butyrate kinase [bacterium]
MKYLLLLINPGSTSTKFGVYSTKEGKCLFEHEILHDKSKLEEFSHLIDQKEYRKQLILSVIGAEGFKKEEFQAVVGRGGLLKPGEGGVYMITHPMLEDLETCKYGTHASNLGAIIAHEVASSWNVTSFIADCVSVDEFEPFAHVSGIKGVNRKARAHVLNLRQVAHMTAAELEMDIDDTHLIGVHLGGGITVSAMRSGKFIDVNNALLGEGPFSPERTGTFPVEDVIDMAFSGKYTKKQLRKFFTKKAGLYSYLGTSDFREILKMIENGNEEAKFYVDAFAYRIAKSIGEMVTVFSGKIDGIFFTGGIARSELLINLVKERVSFLGRIFVFPGQFEMFALGKNIEMALNGTKKIKEYEQ